MKAKNSPAFNPKFPIRHRFVFLLSHPIQYFSPLFKYLAYGGIELDVLYCSGRPSEHKFDREFGQKIQWDIPLLEGYQFSFLTNRTWAAAGSKSFFSLFNPGIITYVFKKNRSTLVIHSWQYCTDWMAIFFGKLAGHRIALWTEVNASHEAILPQWKKQVKKLFFKTLSLFVNEYWCIGTRNREFYISQGVKQSKLRAAPYSVDNNRFQNSAKKYTKKEAMKLLGLPGEAFIFLFSGKYISKKRPQDLLLAFSALKHKDAWLLMVGEGDLRKEMEQIIADHSLTERVRLTGFINQSEIPLYYRAADVFVMCSGVGETWGLSVNEAMNFGLPVVVSDMCGCSADLVENSKNGYVYATENIGELAAKLESLIQMTEADRKAMGLESLKRIEKNSYRAILDGISIPL